MTSRKFSMSDSVTRSSLGHDDFAHLVRGGSLRIGDVEICLERISFGSMQSIVDDAWHKSARLGKVKVKEIGKPYAG